MGKSSNLANLLSGTGKIDSEDIEVGASVSNGYVSSTFSSNTYLQAQGYGTGDVSNNYLNTTLSTKVDEAHTGDVSITGTYNTTSSSFGPDRVVLPTGNTAQRPSSPAVGTIWFNTDKDDIEFYDGTLWMPTVVLDGSSPNNAATSAQAIKNLTGTTTNGFYYISINGIPTQVYCDMQNDGGGWMLVAKANGVDDNYWKYSDAIWTNSTLLNATSDPITTNVHIKTSVYTSYSFTQVRLAMEYLTNGIVEPTWSGTNFASFMGSGRNSSNSRSTWTSWVDTAFDTSGSGWLPNCNQFGTNKAYNYQYIRIGGTINGENDCNSNDESFGFGSRGISPYTNNLSCGAFSPYGKPSGRKKGWIFVK